MSRLFNLVLSSLIFLILTFPMLIIALVIVLKDREYPLYFSSRIGKNNRPFLMPKFRTMHSKTPQEATHLLENPNEYLLSTGSFLRKYSLDELPQLINVLQGSMSLVGPRPLPVDETKRFEDLSHRRRLSVKPGLTCLWQISGRNEVKEFSDWVRLDLEYIDNWSLVSDFKIIIKTFNEIINLTGD